MFADKGIIYSLPFITFGVGILMVSRIKYQHMVNQYLKGKKPFTHLIKILLILGLLIWSRQTVLMLLFCGFALSGFLKWLLFFAFRKKEAEAVIDSQSNEPDKES